MSFLDSSGHLIQLLIALGGGVVLFSLAFAGYSRALFIGLVVMVPFQPIDSVYGSANMAVIYVVGLAMFLIGFSSGAKKKNKVPLIVPFVLLYLALFISWPFSPKIFWQKYMIYLIIVTSNVVFFYMSYYYFRKERDLEIFFKALIFSNVLVIMYCALQLYTGFGRITLFGIEEMSLAMNREDHRLAGPFFAVGITAEYFIIQSLFLAHYMVKTGRLRRVGFFILFLNLAMLVATGNRGGFISMILALVIFLYFYRRDFGSLGVAVAALAFFVSLSSASFVIVKYTEFGVLYDRLLGTEFKGIVPETRIGWSDVIEKIKDKPLIGHGPRIVQVSEYQTPPRNWPVGHIAYYPHNLYLYILYTTGVVGFLAYAAWLITYWRLLQAGRRHKVSKGVGEGLPTLGMIVLVIFLIDQIKVEFLRMVLLDYQHYIAAIFGMFAAYRNIETEKSTEYSVQSDKHGIKKMTNHSCLQERR